nr:MAG TPA: hypothetical protein [Caudoviricetes sp.]
MLLLMMLLLYFVILKINWHSNASHLFYNYFYHNMI